MTSPLPKELSDQPGEKLRAHTVSRIAHCILGTGLTRLKYQSRDFREDYGATPVTVSTSPAKCWELGVLRCLTKTTPEALQFSDLHTPMTFTFILAIHSPGSLQLALPVFEARDPAILIRKLPNCWFRSLPYFYWVGQKVHLGFSITSYRKIWMIFLANPITSWQTDGERMETVTEFIFPGSKITADGDCSHEIKRYLLLGRKAMTKLDSILKSRDITCWQRSL